VRNVLVKVALGQNQCDMCIYRQNTTIFISSIIGYILHWAQLHVSAANAGHLLVVHGLIE